MANDESLLWQGLDLLMRPYNTVMGGVYGALDPNTGVAEDMWRGLKGEQWYGGSSILGLAGFDPNKMSTQIAGLAIDILNPLDPLNYVGMGFTKAGKLARGVKGTTEGLEVATRAAAAEKGMWSAVKFFDKGITPKAVNVPMAKAVDALGAATTRTQAYQNLAKYFGGVKKFEENLPGAAAVMKDARINYAGREDYLSTEVAKMFDGLVSNLEKEGKSAIEAEREAHAIARQASPLLERPWHTVDRLRKDISGVERALLEKDPTWRPTDALTDGDRTLIDAAARRDQDALEGGIKALEEKLTDTTLTPSARKELQDQLFLEWVGSARRVVEESPPRESLIRLRDRMVSDLDHTEKLWNNANPKTVEFADTVGKLLDESKSIYEGIMQKYAPGSKMPIEAYLPHVFPFGTSKVREAVDFRRAERELTRTYAAKGYRGENLRAKVQEELRLRRGDTGSVPGWRGGTSASEAMRGKEAWRLRRKDDRTIQEINDLYSKGLLDYQFETHSLGLADLAYQRASRFEYAHDIHNFIRKQEGWTLTPEAFGKLDKGAQQDWVKSSFSIPIIDPKKDPFRDMYIRRDVAEAMGRHLNAVGLFTTEDGLNGVLGAVRNFTRYWSAWTLAPFPSFLVRNVASDVMLAHQAGLNPILDLAKAAKGESAYATSLGLLTRRQGGLNGLPEIRVAKGNVEKLLGDIEARFGTKVGADDIAKRMHDDKILGANAMRDVDVEGILSHDPIVAKAAKERGLLSKAADWLPGQAPGRSKIVQGGFWANSRAIEYTRSALWVHSLREAMPKAKTLDDAMTYATENTLKELYDYSDLTRFEKKFMKTLIPFWTWSAKNIPKQIRVALTEPGRNQWAVRLMHRAWNQWDTSEISPEDIPDWMERNLGMPLKKVQDENGVETFSIWTPRGWLPHTDLADIAELVRSDGFGKAALSKLNPLLKETFEQALNRDSFTGRAIDEGKTVEIFGIPLPSRLAHVVRNVRLITEMDKLNPGGVFTELGKRMGWWDNARPHRREASGMDRAIKFLGGFSTYGLDVSKEAERRYREAVYARNKAIGQARLSARKGQRLEARGFMEAAEAAREDAVAALARLNRARRDKAIVDFGMRNAD